MKKKSSMILTNTETRFYVDPVCQYYLFVSIHQSDYKLTVI